jgi:hypothetical protein
MQDGAGSVAEVVNSLHEVIESKQVTADVAIVSLISAAGEIALSLIVSGPQSKETYLKIFNSSVEQVRRQLMQELKSRGL